MNINRNNYEEYFILYMDNELPEDLRAEVEEFAETNPDLKAELDLLLQTRLSPDPVGFPDKTSLYRVAAGNGINHENAEHYFLLYLDNELPAGDRKEVEDFLTANPSLQQEFALLSKTKLQEERISFPGKESLYRREERRPVISIKWWRIAAAAVLLLGFLGIGMNLLNKNTSTTEDPSLAALDKPGTPAVKQPAPELPIASGSIIKAVPQTITNTTGNEQQQIASTRNEVTRQAPGKITTNPREQETGSRNEPTPSNNLPTPTEENPYVFKSRMNVSGDDMAEADIRLPSKRTLTNLPEITADPIVTPTSVQPLYTSNASETTDNDVRQKGKGGGFRGLVRKITRTFEKNTNIEATDGDDRLLVAGLAIKL